MTRTKLAGAIAALSLLTAPAVAVAHSGGHHHGRHHHNKHHGKKAGSREVTGAATATVASFTNGVLTITLPSGKSYDGTVTDRTIIKCDTAAPATTSTPSNTAPASTTAPANSTLPTTQTDDHGDQGDDDGAKSGDRGGRWDSGDDNDQGDDNGNGRCDSSALVAGAKVSQADLSLRNGDATWKKVEIVK